MAKPARAQNPAPTVATDRRVRRKRPNRKARIPVRVRLNQDAIATTVARAHLHRCMRKATTTANRRVILKKIFSRAPTPIWARKAASTRSVTSPAAVQAVNPTRP